MILPKYVWKLALFLSLCFFLTWSISSSNLLYPNAPKPQAVPYVTRVVLFQFKQSASPTSIKEITSKMLALQKACVHPSTQLSYIKSISGGKDTSIENLQAGITHAFVVQFSSPEDRDYYVNDDPMHKAFKEAVAPLTERAQIVDFQDGVFV